MKKTQILWISLCMTLYTSTVFDIKADCSELNCADGSCENDENCQCLVGHCYSLGEVESIKRVEQMMYHYLWLKEQSNSSVNLGQVCEKCDN